MKVGQSPRVLLMVWTWLETEDEVGGSVWVSELGSWLDSSLERLIFGKE